MRACPVCETPCDDRAVECPTCGKEFIKYAVADAPAGGLPDFEAGRMDSLAIQIVSDATPDVEHLSLVKVGEVAVDQTPDVELTARAPVGEVPLDETPDVEQTQVARKEWTPDEEGPVLCRACQTPQTDTSSIFCQNCGYRLPVRQLQEAVLFADDGALTGSGPEPDRIKCPQCGSKTLPGGLCSACGVQLRPLTG